MRKGRITILSFTVAAIFFMGCGNDNKQVAPQQQQPKPFPVTVVPQKTVTTFVTYPTSIEGIISSEVRAKVSGYIQEVLVDEGQTVKKGQPLFKLETQSLSQDADAAKAAVNVARVEVEKIKPLVEKGIISNVQLETAKAQLAQAQSTYNSINANIGYATVKSPVNGVVGAIQFREGSLVSATSQKPLTTVSDINQIYAFFSMNETEYLDFLQNTPGNTLKEKVANFPKVKLTLANGFEYKKEGTIQTVTGQIDVSTGTVSFRAIFDNPTGLITNGNSGTISIPNEYENVVVIPQSATFEQQGQTFVYTVNAENKTVATPISIKDKNNYLYLVGSGVSKGDRIVASGTGKLRNNTVIQPQEVAFDSVAKPITPLFQ
ncbi:efflux RND transporter periplasmic adaptor subunit [Mangrovimonas xylaniphaga]|uniref:efflux RND transporter periplasmic adaptor subunit n=1 Tax=Mangrovimonas xylaniphaga TaxID=1645915 RepID=UPI0006B63067|nr:efflux RND transporter periplasmic adaptor subunit [Mangrovimonas xylaniphaga]